MAIRRQIILSILPLLVLIWQPPLYANTVKSVSPESAKKLFSQGKYQQATSLYFELFKQDPDNPEINFYLGRAAFESGDFETAAMAFERVLIVDPGAVQAKLELAKSFYRLGAKPTAIRYFRQLLDSDLPAEIRSSIKVFLDSMSREGE